MGRRGNSITRGVGEPRVEIILLILALQFPFRLVFSSMLWLFELADVSGSSPYESSCLKYLEERVLLFIHFGSTCLEHECEQCL